MAYSTIAKSSSYIDTKLYTGANQTITGIGFQPDFTWIKQRNTASPALFDAIRGATKFLESNGVGAQTTDATTLTSWTSDGFVLGADSSGYVGGSSQATVAWNWKANGSGSSNSDGTTTSTVSVNTTSGFSICQWTGTGSATTIGHGLGAVPKAIWVKNISASNDWNVYHHSIGNTHRLFLNTTQGDENNASAWNDTSPTSSVFTVGTNTNVNQSGSTMIAYVFTDIQGYSKTNKYLGNGNDNGTFIYTGFKPAWIMIKRSDTTESWYMFDNQRVGYNEANYYLLANSSSAEGTSSTLAIDILSNGFKMKNTDSGLNNNGSQYLYQAFGQPIVSTNGDIATAR